MSSTDKPSPADAELERIRALPEALIELIPNFEPRGVPAKLIDKLERAQGSSLPDGYRLYLETLGANLGQIRYYGDTDLRPKTLIKWLQRVEWRSPRYLQIGLAEAGSEHHVFVDRGEDGQGVGVVAFESPPYEDEIDPILPVASCFSTYVLLVLATRAIGDMPASGTLGARGSETGKLPRLRSQLRRAGAEEHPLSGAWDKLFVGPRVLAHGCEIGDHKSLSVQLGCMAPDEWWELAGRLEHELGLKIVRGPG